MSDTTFADFVRQNLISLDELAQRYAKYRIEVIQIFWRELQTLIRENTPTGYTFYVANENFPQPATDGTDEVPGEYLCGWNKTIDGYGIIIGFGFYLSLSAAARSLWPFMSNALYPSIKTCYISCKIDPRAKWRREILEITKKMKLITEQSERDWILWRVWQPLFSINLDDLHRLLTEDRAESHKEILTQLKWWTTKCNEISRELHPPN